MSELDEKRAELLAVLQKRMRDRLVFPIRRRVIDPNAFGNMFLPLRTRRDYTSVGRPVFLAMEMPDKES